jgi:hypothetical protein
MLRPLFAVAPLHDPLNVIFAVDDPQPISHARYLARVGVIFLPVSGLEA